MKKALSLLVSSFVALNLAVTVPASAESADELSEVSADSVVVADDTDIQAFDAPFLTTTTTTTMPTTTTTTTTTTTDALIYTETTVAETEVETTTTDTAGNEYEEEEEESEIFSYRFEIKAVCYPDDFSYLQDVDINMRLVEYDAGYSVLNDKAVNDSLKIKTIAEWNASDINPMVIDYPETNVNHVYVVESDELPENYCYSEQKEPYVQRDYDGNGLKILATTSSNYYAYLIRLYNEPPCEVWDTFPKTVTPEFNLNFFNYTEYVTDIKNVENIPDIEVEIVEAFKDENGEFTLGDVIGNYNTSDGQIFFTKECTFNSMDEWVHFGVKTINLPDYYTASHDTLWYADDHVDEYYIMSFTANNVRLRYTGRDIVLRKQDAPIYTTVTTTTSDTTTTTTTTTTVSSETEETDTTETTTSESEITTTTTASSETEETNTTITTDTTSDAPETTTTTTTTTEDLPQAGMPFARIIETMSLMLVVGGTMLVVKSRRNET